MRRLFLVFLGSLLLASPGCGDDEGLGHGSAGSSGADAATGGAAGSDAATGGSAGSAGSDAGADATIGDAGVPLNGLGAITGDCGPIDPTEITSPSPFTFETVLDFGTQTFDYNALSLGGKQLYDEGNLGGNSLYSEIFSYEVLYRCELATLLKTETKIEYQDAGGKKTDILVSIDGYKVGVSVTRAYAFPAGSTFTVTAAHDLLAKKLDDIVLSTQNVKPVDAWQKQILHVFAYNQQHEDALFQAYPTLPAATRADTIVMVTLTNGDDDFMY